MMINKLASSAPNITPLDHTPPMDQQPTPEPQTAASSSATSPTLRQRPQLQVSHETRLYGIITKLMNLPEVAGCLEVPASAILCYIKAKTGSEVKGTTIVRGLHPPEVLSFHLEQFIYTYIICERCDQVKPKLTGIRRKRICLVCKDPKAPLRKDLSKVDHSTTQDSDASHCEGDTPFGEHAFMEAESTEETTVEYTLANACDDLKQFVNDNESVMGSDANRFAKEILGKVRQIQWLCDVQQLECKLFICLVGIFGETRNIVKRWDSFEAVFTALMAQDADGGQQHLLLALVYYLGKEFPAQQRFTAALFKKLYDNSILSEDLLVDWHKKDRPPLDTAITSSELYQPTAEATIREQLAEFIAWLQTAEYYDEEEGGGAGDNE